MISIHLSNLSFYAARGILMLLVALSILTLAFFIERRLFFRRRFLKQYESVVAAIDQADSLEAVIRILNRGASAEAGVVLKSLESGPLSSTEFADKSNAYLYSSRKQWERFSLFLGSVGSNAPFIGLLGTVLGILKSFADLAMTTNSGPQVVMAGISEALILTAAGLAVAIPAVIFFNICKHQVQQGIGRVGALVALISSKNLFAPAASMPQ